MSITLTWYGADGVGIPFDGSTGYRLTRGALGLNAPPVQNTLDPYLAFDGSALISRRRNVRSITLPLLISATRAQSLLSILAVSFQGPGRLQWSDGTVNYELRNVIYDGGLTGDQTRDVSPAWKRVVAGLVALDPWWYGGAQGQALATAASTTFDAAIAFSATVPFDGGSSSSAVVAGAGETYPVITVSGPGTFTVTLGSLGWTNATALGTGDVLVVDSRPGTRGPRLNGGATNWSLLTAGSRLFTLQPGTQSITSGVVGGSGSSAITMQWEPRYLTP